MIDFCGNGLEADEGDDLDWAMGSPGENNHPPSTLDPVGQRNSRIPLMERTDAQWKEGIKAGIILSRKNVKPLCRILDEAREAMPRGRWTDYLESDDFVISRAEGFKRAGIGKWLRQLKVHTCGLLPGTTGVLDKLRRLTPEMAEACVQDGRINAQTNGPAAEELVGSLVGPRAGKNISPPSRQKRVSKALQGLYALFEECSDSEKRLFWRDPEQVLEKMHFWRTLTGRPPLGQGEDRPPVIGHPPTA